MSEPLSNIEKELAELVEEETLGHRILWDNIAIRASPPLRVLIDSKRTNKSFLSQPIAYLVARPKREVFRIYREQMRKWKRQKEAKARALMVAAELLATAPSEPKTLPEPVPEQNKETVVTKDEDKQPNETPAGGSLSTLTNEGGEEDEENSLTDDEEPAVEKALTKTGAEIAKQKAHGLTLVSTNAMVAVPVQETQGPFAEKFGETESMKPRVASRDAMNTNIEQTHVDIDESTLSYAEMDLAVLLEEWKLIVGHRKFDFGVIGSRGSRELQAVLHHAQMDRTAFADDPVKSVVRIDRYVSFRMFRRELHSRLARISRGAEPMTREERLNVIRLMQTEVLPPLTPRNKNGTAPLTPDRRADRKRKAIPKSPAPKGSRKSFEINGVDEHISHGEDFGLNRTEEEIAWILEELKFTTNPKKGVWDEVERRASVELRREIRLHKGKTNFRKVPLRFLIRRLTTQAFKDYRGVISEEFREGKKRPPIGFRAEDVAEEGDKDEGAEEKRQEIVEASEIVHLPKRTKQERKGDNELTHEFKELADLAIQYDDGKEGIWVDIFENASPHLQVLLRKETPRTPASPPESLVPLHLRPAFREYCAARLSKFKQGGPFDLDDELSEEEANDEALASAVDLLPVSRAFTSRSVTDALQRQKKRLNMIFTRLEIEMEDFVRQEEAMLEQDTSVAKGHNEEILEKVLTRLRSDFLSFREQEEDSLDQHIKDYRNSTLQQPDRNGAVLESMLNGYYKKQGQRVEAFLIRLNETLGGGTVRSIR
jgi:hypothetical protein